MSACLWPHGLQHTGSSVLHYFLEFAQIHVHWVSDVTQPSHPLPTPFSFCLQSFPMSGSFPISQLFTSGGQKYWSFSFSISPSNEYSGLIFRMDWLDLLVVQGTQKSSLTPQVKSINSSALSFLYGPTLTSIHDYWKNHSFDYTELCWQSNISAF